MVQTKVLVDNERVKVFEVRIPPGEKLPRHTHPAYVAYAMNSAKVKITFPDGTSATRELVKGNASYSEGVTHEIENIGSTELINLEIELKG
jgi:quercetin dioxygenase-like cupin family protein